MLPDKHPVFYLLNKLAEYHDAVSSMYIHDDHYYDEQAKEMFQKRIDKYFDREKKAELKAQKNIIEESLRKEKQENSNLDIQKETNIRLDQYKQISIDKEIKQ